MSNLIPIRLAELAVENLENEIKKLKEENEGIKNAGKYLSLKIHNSQKFSDFYFDLEQFEKLIGFSSPTDDCCVNRPAVGEVRRLCEGSGRTGKQKDGRASDV
jgi:hypothetical protein